VVVATPQIERRLNCGLDRGLHCGSTAELRVGVNCLTAGGG
jgi:hypothetical protein